MREQSLVKGASRVIECHALGGWAGENSRRGWVGEKRDFFNTLLTRRRRFPDSPYNRLILGLRQPMHS
jgi:hypothetical protein